MDKYSLDINGGSQIKGIKIKKLSMLIALATAIISVFLVIGIYFSFSNYQKVLKVSDDYVEWQQTAQKMRETSDFLTEQARAFAETGHIKYINYYFKEIENDKNRDRSLNYIKEQFPDSDLYASLKQAFEGSVRLMETEFLSMRLKIDANGYNLSEFPQKIKDVEYRNGEESLSASEKDTKSREILFNDDYITAKTQITNDTRNCMDKIIGELKKRQSTAESNMRVSFTFEVIMIALFIGYSVFTVIITSRQVFDPIIRSIPLIKNDAPMPVEGAHELRILASTYNTMYNSHHKETRSLKFKTEHDALTGALNRRALDKLQVAADDGKVAFLIVDVDNFKHINDNYGHLIGDKILKKIVSYLRLYLRSDDRIFRIGGDEFAVVMFGIDETSKNIIQEKIDCINKTLLEEKPEDLPPISISVGGAFGNIIDQQLITNADNALYKRKQQGKAGISFHE